MMFILHKINIVCDLIGHSLPVIVVVCGGSALHLLVHMHRHCANSCTGYQCRVASSTNCAL